MHRPEFFERAACRDADPDVFFQEGRGVGLGGNAYVEARRYCAMCDVRAECLDYALEFSPHIGFWGGLTPRQRRPLLRDRRSLL